MRGGPFVFGSRRWPEGQRQGESPAPLDNVITLGYRVTSSPDYIARLLLLGQILMINAFFAASEVALLSVRDSRLRHLAEEGNAGARAALALLAQPEKLLSVTQIGVTLASLGMGWRGYALRPAHLGVSSDAERRDGFAPARDLFRAGFRGDDLLPCRDRR